MKQESYHIFRYVRRPLKECEIVIDYKTIRKKILNLMKEKNVRCLELSICIYSYFTRKILVQVFLNHQKNEKHGNTKMEILYIVASLSLSLSC